MHHNSHSPVMAFIGLLTWLIVAISATWIGLVALMKVMGTDVTAALGGLTLPDWLLMIIPWVIGIAGVLSLFHFLAEVTGACNCCNHKHRGER